MKRVLSLVFVLVILMACVFFVGCSNKEEDPDGTWTPFYSITEDIKTEYLF